jgi:hypothetical protein
MAKTIYKQKGGFKGFLFVLGLLIIAVVLVYTQHLVNILQVQGRDYLNFRIKVFEENINNPNTDSELGFFFSEVIQGTDYPVIFTDTLNVPQSWKNINAELDSTQTLNPEQARFLSEYLAEMDADNPPISIKWQGIKLGYYHYGVSSVISRLRWLPYVSISAAALFILIGYLGFSHIKKSEQRYIWVGMAKETAHQLGTPLSSILGWLELLKEDPSQLDHARNEMEIDAARLNKVAARFSQIGSVPALKDTDLAASSRNVVDYFRKRLPQLRKKIHIYEEYLAEPVIELNNDLFEWVLENLIKNAIDSIDDSDFDGRISVVLSLSDDNQSAYIDITDNGKGISAADKKNIFKPGFSTKKRGWGLGLSLAKRIVEDYHGGKLLLKDSRAGEGSTFRLILNIV